MFVINLAVLVLFMLDKWNLILFFLFDAENGNKLDMPPKFMFLHSPDKFHVLCWSILYYNIFCYK